MGKSDVQHPEASAGVCQMREEEVYSFLMKQGHGVNIIRFLLKNMQEKVQPIRISILKSLEYVLENLGCSIDRYALSVLRCIIKTYLTWASVDKVPRKVLQRIASTDSILNAKIFGGAQQPAAEGARALSFFELTREALAE